MTHLTIYIWICKKAYKLCRQAAESPYPKQTPNPIFFPMFPYCRTLNSKPWKPPSVPDTLTGFSLATGQKHGKQWCNSCQKTQKVAVIAFIMDSITQQHHDCIETITTIAWYVPESCNSLGDRNSWVMAIALKPGIQ